VNENVFPAAPFLDVLLQKFPHRGLHLERSGMQAGRGIYTVCIGSTASSGLDKEPSRTPVYMSPMSYAHIPACAISIMPRMAWALVKPSVVPSAQLPPPDNHPRALVRARPRAQLRACVRDDATMMSSHPTARGGGGVCVPTYLQTRHSLPRLLPLERRPVDPHDAAHVVRRRALRRPATTHVQKRSARDIAKPNNL
jgi:hypothetical protein